MGYVPPRAPEPGAALAQLFNIFSVASGFLTINEMRWLAFNRREAFSPRETYEDYLDRLYGHRPPDYFMAINYGLLASFVALIFAIAWLILSA